MTPLEHTQEALQRLFDVTSRMDAEHDEEKPTEEEYQVARREARLALEGLGLPH